ncbi:serine/threonine protein kinase [Luteimonas mephitis]|uniref:serine/threonine protein kinase n=1 Tax=Luteimonas mephitis TaxID=83615 RepID=UPI0003F5D525|nr:serine/threonine-protein kinase [Luteimonas mephitis]
MDAETLAHWRAADALFDQWLDLPEAGREAWLAAQALIEPVRQRLGQLVAAHRRPRAALDPFGGNLAGHQFGGWALDAELGRGGMAVIYRGWREQGMARQQAAIKILTLGALGAVGRDRFKREAAILARLNHPNITALVDSGVADDGTCWLAMPLVEGERIDRWCESNSPDARAIVRLYLQVCAAVACAHRNLVIHRDIKPSNVLVDADGHARLLDFGIGQFADNEDEQTQTMWRALTVGYAAPEQLHGAPPSTAIDVYGLGALLHRLLTGRTPHAAHENTGTTRPSALVRSAGDAYHRHYAPLKNDLDRVLLKALAEEPEHRYPTAEALADDLRRWLGGQPVLAQRPKLGYRVRKFVARNRVGVTAGVLLAASLCAGIGATLWQAGEARREAQRAVVVRDFLAHVFTSTEPAAGAVPTAIELLDEGARRARSNILETDPLAAADILMLTGNARIALDDLDKALADLTQAGELLSASGSAAHLERSRIEAGLSGVMRETGRTDAAIAHGRRAVELGARALAGNGDVATYLNARIRLGRALSFSDPHASRAEFEAVIGAIHRYGLQDTGLHLDALTGLRDQTFAMDRDNMQQHAMHAEEILRLSRLVDGPDSGRYVHTLANNVVVFLTVGEDELARQVAFEAIKTADRIYRKPHSTKALAYCAAGGYHYYTGRNAESLEYYSVADGIYAQLPNNQQEIESCFRMSGHAHLSVGKLDIALANLERAWQILEQLDYRGTKQGYDTCGLLATTQIRLGAVDEAERTLAQCPQAEGAPKAIMRMQAQAELHFARGEIREATMLAAAIRQRWPREADITRTQWMRPWMLSLLLARNAGDTSAQTRLAAELGDLGDLGDNSFLSHCLAKPDETNCLAVP